MTDGTGQLSFAQDREGYTEVWMLSPTKSLQAVREPFPGSKQSAFQPVVKNAATRLYNTP
jgi:hypothetical protein